MAMPILDELLKPFAESILVKVSAARMMNLAGPHLARFEESIKDDINILPERL